MNSYPKDFKNQVYIVAYGITGIVDNVNKEVYDTHQAFEIDKTKMKMLSPLDMDDNPITNAGALDMKGNINMNNGSITNIKAPVNNLDAVNKSYFDNYLRRFNNTTNIYIFGMVDSSKFFTSSSMRIFVKHLKVSYIRLSTPAKYTNKFDSIIIKQATNNVVFPFGFPRTPGQVTIRIDRYFSTIIHIRLEHGTNIPFQIIYNVFY